jgi:hypothetical protein
LTPSDQRFSPESAVYFIARVYLFSASADDRAKMASEQRLFHLPGHKPREDAGFEPSSSPVRSSMVRTFSSIPPVTPRWPILEFARPLRQNSPGDFRNQPGAGRVVGPYAFFAPCQQDAPRRSRRAR